MKIVSTTNCVKQGIVVEYEVLQNACEAVICAMVNSLPEDVQTIEVFDYILQKSKDCLREKVIKLK